MDIIVLGKEINEIKSKNELDLLGQNIWIAPNWKEGFGKFYHMRHGKIMSGFNEREALKLLGFSFKRKTNPKN